MTNTTAVYWSASGQSLSTEAWNVETWGGSRASVGAKRGDDLLVPFRPGRVHQRKERDSRTLALRMWMLPKNPDGTFDDDLTLEQKQHENWAYLMGLFDTDEPFVLTRRWWIGDTVEVATALAELLDGPEPEVTGGHKVEFTVELMLAKPFFLSDEIVEAIGTLDVQGNRRTPEVVLEIGAGRVTFPDGNWIEYSGTGTAVIDCAAGTAKRGSTYVNGQIARNPAFPEWPRLVPGERTLVATGSAAGGVVKYRPAWL